MFSITDIHHENRTFSDKGSWSNCDFNGTLSSFKKCIYENFQKILPTKYKKIFIVFNQQCIDIIE